MTLAAGSRVLVVGAGIAGLATARALTRIGFSAEVIEREPASPDAGTGIYLPGNAARALRALGLDAEVAGRAVEIVSEFAEPAQAILESIDDLHVSAIEEVALDSCAQGHVVLVGDAAHATSPNMAEGAAMALEDALVLAECLADVAPVPRALAAFESRRRARTDWVRTQTHRRDRTRKLRASARNIVLRTVWPRIFRASYAPLLTDA